jgi:hypothetical protein
MEPAPAAGSPRPIMARALWPFYTPTSASWLNAAEGFFAN